VDLWKLVNSSSSSFEEIMAALRDALRLPGANLKPFTVGEREIRHWEWTTTEEVVLQADGGFAFGRWSTRFPGSFPGETLTPISDSEVFYREDLRDIVAHLRSGIPIALSIEGKTIGQLMDE
jgi:hypothetical protein